MKYAVRQTTKFRNDVLVLTLTRTDTHADLF